jgi:predicted branched-subunit amino acid permease
MRPLSRTNPMPSRQPLGVAQAIPVGLAVGAYGLSFGVLAVAGGMSPSLATLSSLLVLGGGSQFAFIGVLAAGGNPMTGAIGGLLLNVRYLAFGLALAPHLAGSRLSRRAGDAYLIVDESVGLGLAAPPGQRARRFRVIGATVAITWIGATAIGAYGGQLLGDPEVFGLDAAFPAGFLALLAPWLRHRPGQVAALVGTALALLLTPVTPPGVPILAAALGAVVAMRVQRSADPRAEPDTRSAARSGTRPEAPAPADAPIPTHAPPEAAGAAAGQRRLGTGPIGTHR